jgi:predicted HicB family RNase H-like nuclease
MRRDPDHILTIRLAPEKSRRLKKWSKRRGESLNAAVNAALTIAMGA